MRVSVIIPTFNRSAYIQRSIDSVVAQTVAVDEIIVVDDERSTDNMADVVDRLYGHLVRVVKADGGLSGARRRGVQEAEGEWIAFLDSDDEWLPNRNSELLAASEVVPEDVAWIFGDMEVVTDDGSPTTLYQRHGLRVTASPLVFDDSLSVQYPFQFGLLQGSFVRRRVLLELDCFNEGLQSSEDLFAGFQVAVRYRYAAISSVVGRYFQTSDLFSSSATVQGTFGPDYYRARMLSFALVVESGRKRPWNALYAAQVRGYCRTLAPGNLLSTAAQQLRYGSVSAAGIAFLLAALFGKTGVEVWNALATWRRKRAGCISANGKSGFDRYVESRLATPTLAKEQAAWVDDER